MLHIAIVHTTDRTTNPLIDSQFLTSPLVAKDPFLRLTTSVENTNGLRVGPLDNSEPSIPFPPLLRCADLTTKIVHGQHGMQLVVHVLVQSDAMLQERLRLADIPDGDVKRLDLLLGIVRLVPGIPLRPVTVDGVDLQVVYLDSVLVGE